MDLESGYKVAKAYNGDTEITTKDSDGNFIYEVPRGGGVNLSVKLEKTAETKTDTTLAAKAVVKSNSSAKISWRKVPGAASYEVYFSKCNYGKKKYTPKKVATVKSGTSYTKKKLKKGKCYKFYVVAKNSKGKVISKSMVGHFVAGNVGGNLTNAKSLSLNVSEKSISAGKSFTIKSTVKKVKTGKKYKLLGSSHAARLRYTSSDKSVATVSSKGVVKGVKAGTCKIYVQTQNGIWKTCTVAVK